MWSHSFALEMSDLNLKTNKIHFCTVGSTVIIYQKRLPTSFLVCVKVTPTSRDEADGGQQSCLGVVHLDGQKLVREGEHQVC